MADNPVTKRVFHEPVPSYMKRLSMMGARFIEGNDGTGSQSDNSSGTEGNQGAQPTHHSDGPQQSGQQRSGQPPASDDQSQNDKKELRFEDFPEEAQRVIRELRAENGRDRTNAKETAAQEARTNLIQEMGKMLGFVKDDKDQQTSLEELQSQIQNERSAAKSATLELEIYKAASAKGLDPNALLDSRSFMKETEDLDPTGKDFQESLSSVLDNAANSGRYGTHGQAPPASSNDHPKRRTNTTGEDLSGDELVKSVYNKLGFPQF